MPRVSVIVTCYRQGRYVGDCLDSIAAQTYRDFELLVYDDESGDDPLWSCRPGWTGPTSRPGWS